MDVVLINSPLYDTDHPVAIYADPPALGLGYIGTALSDRGHNVKLVDAVAEGLSVGALLREIEISSPDVIGTNVFSTNLPLVERIVSGACQTSQILVGGPAAGPLCDQILTWQARSPLKVVIGEAEHAVPALLEETPTLERRGGTPERAVLRIDSKSPWFPASIDLPLDRSLFLHDPIFEPHWGLLESHIVTSRGCGYDCAFCGAARSANINQKIRFRSEQHIANELDNIRALHPRVDCIRVLDDLFLRNPKVIEYAAKLFATRNLRWRAMAHVAGLARAPERVYQVLAASGCLELFVGVESGSPSRRAAIGKQIDLAPTLRVVNGLLKTGISVKAYFIFGFPGETEDEMRATHALATEMAEYASHTTGRFRTSAFKFRPYHGTRLYKELIASGVSPSPIYEDRELTNLKAGRAYDFTSDNFSAVPTYRVDQFIANILGLNS